MPSTEHVNITSGSDSRVRVTESLSVSPIGAPSIVRSGAAVSIVQANSWESDMLPAASWARTDSVYAPSRSANPGMKSCAPQPNSGPPFNRHRNWPGSVEPKLNTGAVDVCAGGAPRTESVGAVRSTTKVVDRVTRLPAKSVPVTSAVWVPTARPLELNVPDVQLTEAWPSTLQRIVPAIGSEGLTEKVTSGVATARPRPGTTEKNGALVSTVTNAAAGGSVTSWVAETPRTSNSHWPSPTLASTPMAASHGSHGATLSGRV